MRNIGTVVRGIRTPIITHGDDLIKVVTDSLMRASESEGFKFKDRDVIGITEAVVGITQGNYMTLEQLVKELRERFPRDVGVVFPILSRNRFSLILKALAQASKEVHVLLSYPCDEVGNHLVDSELVDEKSVDMYKDSFEEEEFRKTFGEKLTHRYTAVDYMKYYRNLGDGNIHIHLSNDPKTILKYSKNVLAADIHTRFRTKRILKESGAKIILGLDDICNVKTDKHGFNVDYGLLGSNKVKEDLLKLFPRDCDLFVNSVQQKMKELTGKDIEVLVYGDGAFKDPVGKIWELADPVVSPGFTEALLGTPKEIKLKYVSENWDEKGSLDEYVKKEIENKHGAEYAAEKSLGTTPRQLTDLLGTLCDLTSGSGDKGTPVVHIQGYFDDYTKK